MRILKNVTLEITSKCNFNCKHCGNDSGKTNKDNLIKQEIYKIIDEIYLLGVERLGITGGEPFCDENLFDYLKYAHNKIPIITISTNGFLIDEKTIELLKKYGVNKYIISLDGTEEYHDHFRGKKDAFKKALSAIKLLINENMEVKVRSVLTKDNEESLLNLIDITNTLKIKRHEILPVCPIGRANENMTLSSSEYKIFLINALKKINSLERTNITFQLKPVFYQEDLFINAPVDCREKSLSYRCDSFSNSLEICYNGDVIGCSFVRIPVGNIRNNTIKELWDSKEAIKIYNMINNQNLSGECKKCQFSNKCSGGCFANRLYGNGIDKKDIYCFVRRRVKNV